jgi:hypothetical protein
LPDKVIVPSMWRMEEMHANFGATYLPTPIFHDEFAEALTENLQRKTKTNPRDLCINGRAAVHDRNGLGDLYAALEKAKGDFSVTVKAQENVVKHPDPRLEYDFSNVDKQSDLYKGFDALILPRRYAGQSLPMCEALLSGLPVVMPDIDPNDKVLPEEWLVPASKKGSFTARTEIDIYSVDPMTLATKLDTMDVGKQAKLKAYNLGLQFEAETLREAYRELTK